MNSALMEMEQFQEESTKETSETTLRELSEVQLAIVGGGSADPIYH